MAHYLLALGLLAVSPMAVGEESLSTQSEEIVSVSSQQEEKGVVDEIKSKVDELVKQTKELGDRNLIFGFTIGSVVSFAITMLGTIWGIHWKHKAKKDIMTLIDTNQNKVEEMFSYFEDAKKQADELYTEIQEKTTMAVVKVNECLEQIDQAIAVLGNYSSFAQNQKLIITILGELANSPEYVKTGAKSKINSLINGVM